MKKEIPRIIYEDNHIVVAFKPAGFLSQADDSDSPDMLSWIKADLKARYHKPGDVFLGLVHRLDQPVSGLMVFARTSKAASRLSELVRSHQFGKYYLAVAAHRVSPAVGHLEDYLIKNPQTYSVSVTKPDQGQFAELDYAVLDYDEKNDCSLLKIVLGTGRSHQIRVQFASRGFPLIGDRRYGPQKQTTKKQTDENQPALFAYRLTFKHPTRDEIIDISLQKPDDQPWTFFT